MARYRVNFDFADTNDSRTLALGCVPHRSRVLDVGIGDGSVCRVLKRLGCRVWGVEYDKELAEESSDQYERLVCGNVEDIDLASEFGAKSFDVVLFLDVLEHLADPAAALARSAAVLAEPGWVVVSIPNVTHGAVKLQLLSGRFEYTEQGLLDATHLRFFDIDSLHKLFDDAGFSVIDLIRVTRPIESTEIPVDLGRVPPNVLDMVREDPEHLTYQFVVTAVPKGSPLVQQPPLLPVRLLQAEVRALQDSLRILTGRDEAIRMDAYTLKWIETELDHLRTRALEHRQAIWDLISDLRDAVAQLNRRLAEEQGGD